MRSSLLLLALPLALGCGDNQGRQILTGRIAPGFPAPISTVDVLRGRKVVATSAVAADGSFELAVPTGSNLSLRLVSSGQAGIVFPRATGTVDTTFAVRGSGVKFDLGMVHFLGASLPSTFSFHTGGGTQTGECDAEEHDASGATCADDGDHQGGSCDGEQQDGKHQDGDQQDGQQDGETNDDGANDTADAPDQGEAVADHNFPADGCADGNDNGGDQGEGGDGSDGSDTGA